MVLITQELALTAFSSQIMVSGDFATLCPDLKPSLPSTLVDRILARDGHQCRAPGCRRNEGLGVERIQPGLSGGGNHPSNLVTVCSVCRPMWDLMGRGPFQEKRAEFALPAQSA